MKLKLKSCTSQEINQTSRVNWRMHAREERETRGGGGEEGAGGAGTRKRKYHPEWGSDEKNLENYFELWLLGHQLEKA